MWKNYGSLLGEARKRALTKIQDTSVPKEITMNNVMKLTNHDFLTGNRSETPYSVQTIWNLKRERKKIDD